LGLWFDESYGGPGLKVSQVLFDGPCTKAESQVSVGEYVLQIDGHDVTLDESMYSLLEGKVGKRVKLTVNAEPKTEGARTVSVKPIGGGDWGNLRYEQWVRECRQRVKELSGGRLYYMHIRGMSGECLERFRRELFGEAQRYGGVVLDIRYNGGGRIHDQLLEELTKEAHIYEGLRNAPRITQPIHLYDKPIDLVINEQCASDAEIFPNGFRTKKLGTIIGMPTYGGVIGTYDITLVNGHGFRVPVSGWRTLEGVDLENYGVPPDVTVPFPYEAHRDGRDTQLEAAVADLLARIGEVAK
jgi:tricorn protease